MADVTTTIREISELTPTAQKACMLFMTACENAGYYIFITETYRSQERQDYLYSLGRTRPGNIVTWTRSSRHTSRRAWDIAVHGSDLYNKTILKKCGAVAKQLGIIWGGTWSTPDYPHFEVPIDWQMPESEDIDMEEFDRLKEKVGYIDETVTRLHAKVSDIDASLGNLYDSVNRLIDTLDKRYNTVGEVPEWARPVVQKLVDEGIITGSGSSLDLSIEMLRILVILDRVGVFNEDSQ